MSIDIQPLETKSVLHPRQVQELGEIRANLKGMLNSEPFIKGQLQDGGAMVAKQLRETDKMLSQAPKPFEPEELDAAVKREAELRTDWLEGMPTQAEMRKNPSGAVDKNMAWDRRNKSKVLAWKTLRRRLHASGISEHHLDDENDVSNIEMFRPAGGPQELNMDNTQIPGTQHSFPPGGVAESVVMTAKQSETLKDLEPEIHDKMSLLGPDDRRKVLGMVDDIIAANAAPENTPLEAKRYDELIHVATGLGLKPFGKKKPQVIQDIRDHWAANGG